MVNIFLNSNMTSAERISIVSGWIILVAGGILLLSVVIMGLIGGFKLNYDIDRLRIFLPIALIIAVIAVIMFISSLAYRSMR